MSEQTAVDACTEAEMAVQSYLDGVLSTEERARIEAHLARLHRLSLRLPLRGELPPAREAVLRRDE